MNAVLCTPGATSESLRRAVLERTFETQRGGATTQVPPALSHYVDTVAHHAYRVTDADLRALQADFVLAADPDSDGLEWVRATPKAKDGSLQNVRIGFQAGVLSVLEIVDNFGQKSSLRFNGFKANAALDASSFQYKPPAGADVIQQ